MSEGMNRRGIRPRFRFGIERPGRTTELREVLPFRRSWIAIVFLAAFDLAFLIPAITTFRQAAAEWSRFDSLFDLVGALFLTAWLMGWSIGPLVMTTILLLMLFGREVLKARPGAVEIWLGVPGLGFAAVYDPARMRNLRLVTPPPKSGRSWRGPHLAFDYGANSVRFGSNLGQADLGDIESGLESATGTRIGRGKPSPEDLQGEWEVPEFARQLAPSKRAGEQASEPDFEQPGLFTASAVALLLANLVPLAGAAFLGWSLSDVMVLYWAESAIIGLFNVCKIAVIGRWFALAAGPFFLGHFGGFMAVHFLFIYTLFVKGITGSDSGGDLREVALLFVSLWPALAALLVSHAYSFFVNFIGRREYRGRTMSDQMSEPYARIIFMHLVLIFGGFGVLLLGDPVPILILVIVLKICMDLVAHRKQRQRRKATAPETGASA
jgi:hypothetical protein